MALMLAFGGWLGSAGIPLAHASPSAAPPPTPVTSMRTPGAGPPRAIGAGEDIRDIHGPIAVAAPRPLGWLIAGAGALLLVAAGLAVAWRRRRPSLPPHERALRALAALQAAEQSDARIFSFTVSEIVRVYVEEAFTVRAAHRTTEELLADLMRDQSPIAAHRPAIAEFLHHCDLAKFAGWSLSPAEMAAMLASAETLVRATAPVTHRHRFGAAAFRKEGLA
jgi:hypothetical protein